MQALEILLSSLPGFIGCGVSVYLVRRHYLQELAKLRLKLYDAQATSDLALTLLAPFVEAELKRRGQ